MSPVSFTIAFVVRGGGWYSQLANFVWSECRSWSFGIQTSDTRGFRSCLLVRRAL